MKFGFHYVSAKALVVFSKVGFHIICIHKANLISKEAILTFTVTVQYLAIF